MVLIAVPTMSLQELDALGYPNWKTLTMILNPSIKITEEQFKRGWCGEICKEMGKAASSGIDMSNVELFQACIDLRHQMFQKSSTVEGVELDLPRAPDQYINVVKSIETRKADKPVMSKPGKPVMRDQDRHNHNMAVTMTRGWKERINIGHQKYMQAMREEYPNRSDEVIEMAWNLEKVKKRRFEKLRKRGGIAAAAARHRLESAEHQSDDGYDEDGPEYEEEVGMDSDEDENPEIGSYFGLPHRGSQDDSDKENVRPDRGSSATTVIHHAVGNYAQQMGGERNAVESMRRTLERVSVQPQRPSSHAYGGLSLMDLMDRRYSSTPTSPQGFHRSPTPDVTVQVPVEVARSPEPATEDLEDEDVVTPTPPAKTKRYNTRQGGR